MAFELGVFSVLERWWKGAIWLLALALIGCASRTAGVNYAEYAANDPRSRPFVVGPSDLLRVTVWKDPGLSTETSVRPDGRITLPLVGEIEAAGLTTTDIQKRIEQRLAAYVKDAIVTVALVEVNSYHFTVAGNVEHPGMFTPRYYVTVAEAVALAGGPNRYASPDETVVIRPQRGDAPKRIPVDYEKIVEGKRPEQNIVVLAGDTLLVP